MAKGKKVQPFSKAIDEVKGNDAYTWNSIQRLKNLYLTPCTSYKKFNAYFRGLDYQPKQTGWKEDHLVTEDRKTIIIIIKDKVELYHVGIEVPRTYKKPSTIEGFIWTMAQEGIPLYWSPKIKRTYFDTLNWQ